MSQSVSSPPTYEAAVTLPSQDLLRFWEDFKLVSCAPALNAYLGVQSLEDLEDVHLADLKTIAFDDWAINHLSVVQKNRLRRAVNYYHIRIRASAALDPPTAEAASAALDPPAAEAAPVEP
jgi:hypothetical protein